MILTFIWIGILSFLIFPNLMWASVVLVLCGCGVIYAVINILFNMVHRNTDSPQSYWGVRRRGNSEFGCFADVVVRSSKQSWFEGSWQHQLAEVRAFLLRMHNTKGAAARSPDFPDTSAGGGRWRGGGMQGRREGERELWNTHVCVKECVNG